MNQVQKYAVLGSGSAGHAIAVLASQAGFAVQMYDTDPEKIAGLQKAGEIVSTGELTGRFPIALATLDPAEAIEGCQVIMVCTLSCDHADVAEKIAPYIRPDQLVVLNPGATCGALEFRNVLREHGVKDCPVIAETQDLVCTCRSYTPGTVNFTGIKSEIALATIPAGQAQSVCQVLAEVYPHFIPQKHVLYTSLGNMAPVNHPAPTVLNITRVEEPEDFHYFKEGFTPSIGTVVEAMDQERRAIARKFGMELISVKEWLHITYHVEGANLFEAMRNTPAYTNVLGPNTLNHRYIFEDLPTGLVPMTMLARVVGVPTPVMDSILELLCVMTGIDYRTKGRTLERLGLAGKTAEEILQAIS